ncbi:unnamed protein product [Closterium sp. NIES-53]
MGRHLVPFTHRTASSLCTVITEPPQVAASTQVSASGPVAAPCSCRLLSHQTHLWHHRLGHPSLPRLRGMHSRLLVSGLPRSLPPLSPSPALPCLPCVEERQRAAPQSSSFPPTTAPLQTLHMDVKGEVPNVLIPWIRALRLQLRDRFREDLPVLRLHYDRGGEFSSNLLRDFCRGEGILQSFTLLASPQQNRVAERRIGLVMEVARTSMIHAAAPNFLWPFAVRYAAHQLNLWPRVSLPETSPTLCWTGKVGDASVFRFYHPTSRRVLPSQDITFDESVPFYRLFPYRTAPLPPPPPLFLAPDPIPLAVPVKVVVDSCAARGAVSGGVEPASAKPGGAEPEGTEPGGAEPEGAESGGAEPEGAEPGGTEPEDAEPGGAESEGVESKGAEPRAHTRTGGSTAGGIGAGGAGAAGPGGARTSGTGANGAGGVGGAGAGDPCAGGTRAGDPGARGTGIGGFGAGGTGSGGAGASSPGGAGVTAGAGGTGGAGVAGPGGALTRGAGAEGAGARGTKAGGAGAEGAGAEGAGAEGAGAVGAADGGTGAGDPGAGAAGAGGAGAGGPGAGGTVRRHPFFVPPQPSSLLPPDSALHQVLKRREHESRPASPVRALRTGCRVPRPRPPPVPGTHIMTLRPSSVPLRFPLPSPPTSSLPDVPDPESELARAASPAVPRLLTTVATSLAAESESDCPPSVGGDCALGTDILEDRQEDFECHSATVPHLVAMLLHLRVTRMHQTSRPRALTQKRLRRYYELHALDISTSFLQGSLHEEIWLRRPAGFIGSFPVGTQWSLRRPVYGVRQAPRKWHDTLRMTLVALGFAPSTANPSLFLRTDTSLPPFYVLVYVDDLVFATADIEALALVKSELQKRHSCTDLGELRNYLGLQITHDRARRTITLTQSHMVHQVLQRFGFRYSSPQSTPLPTGHSLSAPPSDESVESSGPYPELVGCLKYLMTCTQPDLAYPLSILACYVAPGRHRPEHWEAAKRVLRYLCSTSGMGLVLGGRGPIVLIGHADASWVDDLATQWSSQGYTFSLGSGFVSWRSTRSSSVLSSSCEAEIYAGAMAAQELRWLTYLLTDLGERPHSSPVLYVENKAMIALYQEHRTKHIDLCYFLARELQQRGQLRLAYVAIRANTADIFTKAL